MQGHWNKTLEETTTLLTKLGKLATELGVPTLKELGYASKEAFREQKLYVLRTHREDPPRVRRMGETRFPQTPFSRGNSRSHPSPPPKTHPKKKNQ